MKRTWIVLLMVMVLASATAFAGEVREVTVKGDAVRGPLVAGLVNSYFPDTRGNLIEDKTLGEYVIVEGSPGGSEKIHFSSKLVAKLQKLAINPRTGEGLMDICPTQAGQLVRAVGPMKAISEPLISFKCDSVDCWPRNPTGNYFSIGKLGNAIVFGNKNNSRFPANSVSAKIEKDSGVLVYKVAVRNPTTNPKTLLVPGLCQEIEEHFLVTPLKANGEGADGDSCFEKTWIVNPATKTWSIWK